MAAAAKKAVPNDRRRRALSEELLGIFLRHRKDLERADEIKSELKAIATDDGNFQEVVIGKGKVSVAGKKDKAAKGEAPEVDVTAFLALTPAKRDKLLEGGVVKMVTQYSGAFYGSVSVDLF